MNQEELKNLIKVSFADTQYPAGKLTDTYDDEGATELFSGTRWQDQNPDILQKHYATLHFLEPDAFRYFLPAFMLAVLEDTESPGNIAHTIAFSFGKPEPDWESRYTKRIAKFSPIEKQAILQFMDFLYEKYGYEEVIYASRWLHS